MNAKVGSLSGNPACEAGKLIVEVIGKDHPAGQRVVIYDETDNELQEWLTDQVEQEVLVDARQSSTLHIWQWDTQPKRHLWLEIEAERGAPIRVPLMEDTCITPRQQEQQWNRIIPVVPMTILRGVSAKHQHKEYPVQSRPGFLYIYYRGKLWRELEIRQTAGCTTYHDVRLSDFRRGTAFGVGSRAASGKALEEIWLPAQWNNRAAPDIEAAYSEVQLPAARLNRFEQDARLRHARCNRLSMALAERTFGNTTLRPASQQRAFYLHNVPGHRPREVAREWLLDQPLKHLHDLGGQYPLQSLQYARQTHQGHERGESNPGPTHPQQTQDDLRPETGAWLLAVNDTLKAEDQAFSAVDDSELWQAEAAVPDALDTAKQRQIAGILLEDGLYRMRHLLARINEAQGLLQLCALRASLHVHHGSALLLQRLMVPAQIGGQANPLHRHISQLTHESRRQIDLCAARHARELARSCLNAAQDNLAAWLEQAAYQHALGDHFCLDGFDYAGTFYLCSQLFVALARTAEQQDPLEAGSDAARESAGRRLLRSIADSERQPLYGMLWPVVDDAAMCVPYQPVPTVNQGDGLYRGNALAQVALLGMPPVESQATFDAAILAGLMQQPDFLFFPAAKSGASALVSIWENLTGALQEAQKNHGSATAQQRQAATESRRADGEARQRQAELTWETEQIARQKQALGELAFPVKTKLFAKNVQLLRSMLQDDFAELVFIRRSAANQKNYFFFGLDELPARPQRSRTVYGELLDREGKLLASSNNQTASRAGVSQQGDELLLLAVPKNHRTAQLARELNRQFAEQQRIQADLSQAGQTRQAANGRLSEANSALQQARNQLATQESGWRKPVRGALDSKAFPAGILILEMFNVQAEFDVYLSNVRNKNKFRALGGVVSAGVDLLLAMEILASKVAHNQPLMQAAQKKVIDRVLVVVSPKLVEVFGDKLVKEVTGKLAFQSFAGTLFVGINLYDALHEMSLGDDAAWGYGLMAVGGLVGVAGGFFTASGATLLGLGPVAWATLLLILAGVALVWWLDDAPLEEWLTNGPFGDNRSDKVAHLWNDPQETFYRLVSLFAGIRISIGANPEQARHSGAMGLLDPAEFQAMRRANTRVRIESNLPGLAASLGSASIRAHSRLRSSSHRLTHKDHIQLSNHSLSLIQPLAQRLFPDALELFYEVPASQTMPRREPFNWQTHELVVRAQINLQGEVRNWVFPAPPPADRLSYNADEHGEPKFDTIEQPYWADEQTYSNQDIQP